MKEKKSKMEGLDVTNPEFWEGMKFELIEVTTDGEILVRDTITKSDMTFNTRWTPFQIAKAVSNARAQWLK